MPDAPVNTKACPSRALELKSLDELRAELDRIQSAHDAGTLTHTGNWSPGQILEHLALPWVCALDGFPPTKIPFILRMLARILAKKKTVRGTPPPPGIKLPKQVAYLAPKDDTTFDDGMSALRACIERVERGERMTHRSPLFGSMDHQQWLNLQLGHCALHLGYLSY